MAVVMNSLNRVQFRRTNAKMMSSSSKSSSSSSSSWRKQQKGTRVSEKYNYRQSGARVSGRSGVVAQAAKGGGNEMKSFMTYLSTAPVLLLVVGSGLSGLVIEVNRYFPDLLTLANMN